MTVLPSGTVTVLFTDIEGSTRLLEEHGDAYAEMLERHRRVLRDAYGRHGGVEVDTQGDAFFVAFARASDAVAAALEAQRKLELPVRMGIHTGEPQLVDGSYVGIDVHRGARICAVGHGGQVLVSESTQRLLAGVELRELGLHRLKDVGELRLYQLGTDEFPPLRSLNQTNLPTPSDPLVGRKKELADVLRLFQDDTTRLVTITGPGGIGKTRFALELAADLVQHFRDGVWFVDLSALREAELVVPTIAATLGQNAEQLGDRELLLLLDNLEQVVQAAPQLATLLDRSPNVRLLATSREPLQLRGERRYPLRPLAESPAVELFRRRAHALDPEFSAPYDELARLCRLLDNLPLALELAAARTATLSVSQLLERLEERLPLLTSRGRDLPERQRTLAATIEWSYDLLEPQEQELFRRLGVFVGGFTLEAAEEVAYANLDTLESLHEKSLLRQEGERFSMLETIREFARDHLDATAEAHEILAGHARWFAELATSLRPALWDAEHAETTRRYDQEHTNCLAAADWAARNDPKLERTLVRGLYEYWLVRAYLTDGRTRLEHAFAQLTGADSERSARIDLLVGIAALAGVQDDDERATAAAEEAVALTERDTDPVVLANALIRLANSISASDAPRARELYEEAVRVARPGGPSRWLGVALLNLGDSYAGESPSQGRAALEEALHVFDTVGNRPGRAAALLSLAEIAIGDGRTAETHSLLRQSLAMSAELGQHARIALCLGAFADLAETEGALDRAMCLRGAVDRIHERLGVRRAPFADFVRAGGEEASNRLRPACTAGREMTLDGAVEYALADD